MPLSPEEIKLSKIVAKVQKKLGTAFNFYYSELPEDDAFLRIGRTERGSSDPVSFILYFSKENIQNRSTASLTRDVFHELLHAIHWTLDDVAQKYAVHIKDKKLRKEFLSSFNDAQEAVTYLLERNIGKYVFPTLDWKND